MFDDILFSYQDLDFKKFNSKLVPNISSDRVIGVKVPIIRKIAKDLYKTNNYQEFINTLPHKYLEEYILNACFISLEKDINKVINMLEIFLPYVDNWCVCDMIKIKCIKGNHDIFLNFIKICLKSKHTYMVRFGIVSLLSYYLDDEFDSGINTLVLKIKSNEYYINMAIAWYFSFAIIKQYDSTIYIFENKLLDKWVHNKSIQKCIESYRIDKKTKDYLKSLKQL